jgi:hypothetical protein
MQWLTVSDQQAIQQFKPCVWCGQPKTPDHDCPYSFKPVEEYLKLPRAPQKWIVQDLVPVGGIVNIFAKPKVGKTFMYMGIGEAISSGHDEWEGFEVFQHGKVAFLEVDTPREEFADRFIKMAIERNAFYVADMWMVPNYPFDLLDPNGKCYQWLKEQMDALQPLMVVVDTIREVHEKDENDSTGMKQVVSRLISACRPATIVLISHARKEANSMFTSGGESDLMDDNRGSNYVAGKADVVIKLTGKQLTYKGRATGLKKLPIKQDENGFIRVIYEGSEEDKIIKEMLKNHPGESVNSLAKRLVEMKVFKSISSATRRINRVKEKQNG